MSREPVSLRNFSEEEIALLEEAGVRELLAAGPLAEVYEAIWQYGVHARYPERLSTLAPVSTFDFGTPETNAALVRRDLLQYVVSLLHSNSLESAARMALSGRLGDEEYSEARTVLWNGLPAGLRAKAEASWVHRAKRHLDYASGRIARLARLWYRYRNEPISVEVLEMIAVDIVDLGCWKASSERVARERAEQFLRSESYLADRLWLRTRKSLGHPSCDGERELIYEVIRGIARARMAT